MNCFHCGGKGKVLIVIEEPHGLEHTLEPCGHCLGSGQVCDWCKAPKVAGVHRFPNPSCPINDNAGLN